jgi:glycosyltransferase involved in cell wall biosynthesis
MTPPKILYVVTQADRGGAQKYVLEMAQVAKESGYNVDVAVGQSDDRSLVESLKSAEINVIELRHLVRQISPLHDVQAVFELWRAYNRLKPTTIHLNSSKAGVVGSVASLLAKLTGTPHRLIYTVHGWSFMESGGALKKITYLVCEWLTAPLKDKIIYITRADEQIAHSNHFFIRQSTRIPNGIDTRATLLSREDARTQLNIPSTTYSIGTIANFYATKGLSDFITIINQLRITSPDIIGVIIGDGPLRAKLETQIKDLELQSHVILIGKKENAQQYLPAFDLYLSTSHKEGFPYTILEAMYAKLPIVATNVGGINEIIHSGKNGTHISVADISTALTAITYYRTHPESARAHGEQAYHDVVTSYTLTKSTAETLKCYL